MKCLIFTLVLLILFVFTIFISIFNDKNNSKKTVIIDGKESAANFTKYKNTDYINGKEVVENYVMQVEIVEQWQLIPVEKWCAQLKVRVYKKGLIICTDYNVSAICASREDAFKKLKIFRIGSKEFIDKNRLLYESKGFEIANTVDQRFE